MREESRKFLIPLLICLLFSALFFPCLSVSAQALPATGKCGEHISYTFHKETGTIVFRGSGETFPYVTDPDCPGSGSPFAWNMSIRCAVFEPGITGISTELLYGCGELERMELADTVRSIGCYSFFGCKKISELVIPKGVEEIDPTAFLGCDALSQITVDADNPTYDSRGDCHAVVQTKTNTLVLGCNRTVIPAGVTKIGEGAFCACRELTEIRLPDSVTEIGRQAFNGCETLETVTLPGRLTRIGAYAFQNCKNLKSIALPTGLQSIGESAFAFCESLTEVTIPESVAVIETSAFSRCGSLKTVRLPDRLIRIQSYNFIGTALYDDPANWENGALYLGNHLISVDGNLKGRLVIRPGTKTVAGSACEGRDDLTGIVIPESVGYIGVGAFSVCRGVTDVTVPNGVKTVDRGAFAGCSSLQSVTLPASLGRIGSNAFSGCNALTDISYDGTQDEWKRQEFSKEGLPAGVTLHFGKVPASQETDTDSDAHGWETGGKLIAVIAAALLALAAILVYRKENRS